MHVEIKARESLQRRITVERPGDVVTWSFFTRRKNIAFGMYYMVVADGEIDPNEQRQIIEESREQLTIYPPSAPKPGQGISGSSSQSELKRQPSFVRSEPARLETSNLTVISKVPDQLQSCYQHSNASHSVPDLRINDQSISKSPSVQSINSSSPNLKNSFLLEGSKLFSGTPRDGNEFVEIIPTERYQSFEMTVKGEYSAPLPGTYILFFDNSYSISTSKELFLMAGVVPKTSESIPDVPNLNRDSHVFEEFGGWLLKKKQRRIQGWARRWFQLDSKGNMAYFADRFSPCRGSIPVQHATITWTPPKRMLTIDAAGGIFHLRAQTDDDYQRWSERLNSVRARLASQNLNFLSCSNVAPLSPLNESIKSLTIGRNDISPFTAMRGNTGLRDDTINLLPETLIFPTHITDALTSASRKLTELRNISSAPKHPVITPTPSSPSVKGKSSVVTENYVTVDNPDKISNGNSSTLANGVKTDRVPQHLIVPLEQTFASLNGLYQCLAEYALVLQRAAIRQQQFGHVCHMSAPESHHKIFGENEIESSLVNDEEEEEVFFDTSEDVVILDVSDEDYENSDVSSYQEIDVSLRKPFLITKESVYDREFSQDLISDAQDAVGIDDTEIDVTENFDIPPVCDIISLDVKKQIAEENDILVDIPFRTENLTRTSKTLDSQQTKSLESLEETGRTSKNHILKHESATLLEGENYSLIQLLKNRTEMPYEAPIPQLNLGSMLMKNIGKDWSTLSMPVAMNEPLGILQQMAEDFEYSHLLDKASRTPSKHERMALVCAFAISSYAVTTFRADRKPTTPVLGETFEYVDLKRRMRFISEKVSHRPLIVACHAEGGLSEVECMKSLFRVSSHYLSEHNLPIKIAEDETKNMHRWSFWRESRPKTKFWGKSMELVSNGRMHLHLKSFDEHYTWGKVTTCVRNILAARRTVENYGDTVLLCESSGDVARIKFRPASASGGSSIFSSVGSSQKDKREPNEVTVTATWADDPSRQPHLILRGRWDSALLDESSSVIWKATPPPDNCSEFFGFSSFARTLNDLSVYTKISSILEESKLGEKLIIEKSDDRKILIMPTDSRLRTDQRMLEENDLTRAESEKLRIEQIQRDRRITMQASGEIHQPRWFIRCQSTSKEDDPEGVWRPCEPQKYWDVPRGSLIDLDPLW